MQQKKQTYKELIEQLNALGTGTGSGAKTRTREAVAIRRPPSRNIVVTIADGKACMYKLASRSEVDCYA